MPKITTVGYMPLSQNIVVGKVDTVKRLWDLKREDVTHAALHAAANYLLNKNSSYSFEHNGVNYSLKVEQEPL